MDRLATFPRHCGPLDVQILVERALRARAAKRWGGLHRVSLNETLVGAAKEDDMLPALDEALTALEQLDPEQAKIVESATLSALASRTPPMPSACLRRRSMRGRGCSESWVGAATMTPAQFQRVRELFEQALEKEPPDVGVWLD